MRGFKNISYYYSKFFKKVVRGKSIKNSILSSTAVVNSGCNIVNSNIDDYTYIGYDCEIINCEIGKYCSLAADIFIGGAEHPTSWVSTSPIFQNVKNSSLKMRFARKDLPISKKTIIGNDVWIGTKAIIKGGITVGTGAVIAAGSVVTKDVEPYAIVGGCPAKVIRYRFPNEIIEKLLNSKWWELTDDQMGKVAVYITSPEDFIEAVEKL